ncbi:hypothetical protein ACWDTG_24775 [Rhodococcus zopfii]
MSNTAVAELVTVTVAGAPVRAEITEIITFHTSEDGRFVDVRLADGTVVEHADALDIAPRAA